MTPAFSLMGSCCLLCLVIFKSVCEQLCVGLFEKYDNFFQRGVFHFCQSRSTRTTVCGLRARAKSWGLALISTISARSQPGPLSWGRGRGPGSQALPLDTHFTLACGPEPRVPGWPYSWGDTQSHTAQPSWAPVVPFAFGHTFTGSDFHCSSGERCNPQCRGSFQ